MQTIQYPNGNQFTSTAWTDKEVQTFFQYIGAQLLGILTDPLILNLTLVNGSAIATPSQPSQPNNTWLLYAGESVVGTGISAATKIIGVDTLAGTVTLSSPATASVVSSVTVTDSMAFAKVRVGWQKQGQPGPSIDSDTAIVRCVPMDSPYSRLRDNQFSSSGTQGLFTDIFTRSWKSEWTFYGPNALNRAKLIQSGLINVQFSADYLASKNLYINPSIHEPERIPERFQGQWWERMDMVIDLNEQITETLTVGTVKSVEVKLYNETGLAEDFTVTAP